MLAAAAATFIFGGIWYGALGNPWMKTTGITPEQVEGGYATLGCMVIGLVLGLF